MDHLENNTEPLFLILSMRALLRKPDMNETL